MLIIYSYFFLRTEATFFALFMCIGHFGKDISVYLGAVLLAYMDVGIENWDNMSLAIVIKSLIRAVPLFLIPVLVPPGRPTDSTVVLVFASESFFQSVIFVIYLGK